MKNKRNQGNRLLTICMVLLLAFSMLFTAVGTTENVTIRQQPEWKVYQKRLGNYEKITAEDGKITLRPFETIVLDSAL